MQLEGEVQYLRDLTDVAQVIVQEQGDKDGAFQLGRIRQQHGPRHSKDVQKS